MSADTPEPVTGQSTDTPEPVTGQTGTTDEPRAQSTGEADQAPARGVDWVSLGAVVLLLGAAGATHGAVFGDTSGYTAVAGGIALGSLIGLAGARWRWSLLETLLATTLTYLLAGGALALPATTTSRLVPTLATLQGLVTGAVEAWKDLITLSPPAGAFVGPAIVPYLAGLLASVTAVTTALRTTRRQAWALVPVAALGLVGVLWGSQNAPPGPARSRDRPGHGPAVDLLAGPPAPAGGRPGHCGQPHGPGQALAHGGRVARHGRCRPGGVRPGRPRPPGRGAPRRPA